MNCTDALDPKDVLKHKPTAIGVEAEYPIYKSVEHSKTKGRFIQIQVSNDYRTSAPNQPKHIPTLNRIVLEFLAKVEDGTQETSSQKRYFHPLGMIYVDQGCQIEITTHETADPFEVAHYFRRQRDILSEVLEQNGFIAFTNNTTPYTSFAFHENYQSSFAYDENEVKTNHLGIIPHFISRVIYCGIGGAGKSSGTVKGTKQKFSEFVLSPRLTFIECKQNSNSTGNRGIILTRAGKQYTNCGSRLQTISADQPIDEETIALMLGSSAIVSRLNELGLLPETDIDWFESKGSFENILDGVDFKWFEKCIDYQKEVLKRSQEYICWLEANDLPDFFGSRSAAVALFEVWEERLASLQKYIVTGDIGYILSWSEWAKKLAMIEQGRERESFESTDEAEAPSRFLTDLEQKRCLSVNKIGKVPNGVRNFQNKLNGNRFKIKDGEISNRRSHLRMKITEHLNNLPGITLHDLSITKGWDIIQINRPRGGNLITVHLRNTYCGSEEDLNAIKKAINKLNRKNLPRQSVTFETEDLFAEHLIETPHPETGMAL